MINPNPTISICIVVFQENMNMLGQVFAHLKTAISKTSSAQFKLYIVDNHPLGQLESPLTTLAESTVLYEKNLAFEYIKTGKNIGYGAANNVAIRACESDYHLIMNPDVFVSADTFSKAIAYMQTHQEVGLLTPSVYGVDQTRQYLCKQNPTLFDMFLRGFSPNFIRKLFARRISLYEMREKNYDQEIRDVPFPTGCFMFARTEVLKKNRRF
jgi:GT2 family glycosyltransferase